MNIGVIFAGGVGKRMNSRVKPKQFIDVSVAVHEAQEAQALQTTML